MATVKKANVPPTHPTVYGGLALAAIGLLLAMYAYTGARVYDITFAFIALGGGFIALVGILAAAWGRSIMSSRASRARRSTMSKDALVLGKPEDAVETADKIPTIAKTREKKRFSFGMPKREQSPEKKEPAALFAFKRQGGSRAKTLAADDPRNPDVSATLTADAAPAPEPRVRVTLKCPQCSTQFDAEGVRPFEANCSSCGFSSTV